MKFLVLFALILPSAAMGSMIKLYCVSADSKQKTCYRVVHVLSQKEADERKKHDCWDPNDAKKDNTTATSKPTKTGAAGAR